MSLAYFAGNAASADRARRRMQRAGFTMKDQKLWDEAECKILIDHEGDYDSMQKLLPNRTRVAIYEKCGKMGLRRRVHVWSAGDVSRLRRMFLNAPTNEICSAFPHSTWVNIQQVARYHGMRRDCRTPYKLTGIPALDEVRRRCFAIRWTMSDLDKAARTGNYFRRSGWIGKRINHRALGRAIEALDGIVQAQWNE